MTVKRRFKRVAAAGIAFQAGSAAVDSATIMSALVFHLTGSSLLVGAVTATLRFGWLFPQLIVGFLAQNSGSSMRFYMIGAFGRAGAMAVLALTLLVGREWPPAMLGLAVMGLWTVYAFVSGIVAVPYNDIVARSVPSELRSRLLATRFFGGGLLALGVAFVADGLMSRLEVEMSFAAVIAMASGLMFLSSIVFTLMGEPDRAGPPVVPTGFLQYLHEGLVVFRNDSTFAAFVWAQWFGGAVLMAMPFYVVRASQSGVGVEQVATLLGAQTFGALVSNPLWGWWGDQLGKTSLLRAIALGRVFPPVGVLFAGFFLSAGSPGQSVLFVLIFFMSGALANGLTIGVIGFLMEISPEDRRPAYSGYFNAITAPAFLLPLAAGGLAGWVGLSTIFALSAVAALCQSWMLQRVRRVRQNGV